MIIEDEILVLKEIRYNDNDKILHALSRNNGKIQIVARGCRKNKSPLVNISQIMSYSKCELYISRDMYIINSGELINNFYNIRSNITAFLYGTYVLELLNYISQENDVDGKAYDMTIRLFQILNSVEDDEKKIENIISIYELKLISMLGYRPQLGECIVCGNELHSKNYYYFNIKDGGIQCKDCVNANVSGYDISYKNIVLLNNILRTKLDDITTLKLLKKGDIYG